jgi:hypothetical protein
MTEIIYKRGRKPKDIPDPIPPEDNSLKASFGDILREKIPVDTERGVYKRKKHGKRRKP